MAVTAQTPFSQFTAAPGATVFSSEFRVLQASDLVVKVNGAVIASGFSVSGIGAAGGVDVTFSTPMTGGEVVELLRDIPLTRATDYQQLGDFLAPVVNLDFDRLWMSQQDQGSKIGSSLRLPFPEQVQELPAASGRIRKLFYFDENGDPVMFSGTPGTVLGFNSSGDAVAVVPASGSAVDLALYLATPGAGRGDHMVASDDGAGGTLWTTVAGFIARVMSSAGSSVIGFIQSGAGAIQRSLQDKARESVSVEDFGATGTNDSAAFAAAFASGANVVKASKSYSLANVTIPDGVTLDAKNATFSKNANGQIFSMGRRSQILGGPVFDGGASSGFTGSSIVIDTGDNVPTYSQQGHQLIEYATFRNSESYHVAYTTANKGWMSRLIECKFVEKPANAPAAVLWPDEPTAGGNRHITGGYSACPVVNVGGCDNGIVTGVVIGASTTDLSQQGVYFPEGTTNPAKKVIITGNRLAFGTNKMTVRGVDHMITDNVCAGSIELASGTTNCVIGPNRYASPGKLIDSSGALNEIFETWESFTPVAKSGITLGNASLTGEYQRDGQYVNFRMTITFGSTTSVSGSMVFQLPVPIVSGTTARCLGQAMGGAGYVGIAFIDSGTQDVRVQNAATLATWDATVPFAWSSGSVLVIAGRYRI